MFMYRSIWAPSCPSYSGNAIGIRGEGRIRHQAVGKAPSVTLLRAQAEQAERPINLQALARPREAQSIFWSLGRSSDRTLENDEDIYARVIIPQRDCGQGSEDMVQKSIKMMR
jgi:hypothetical protein